MTISSLAAITAVIVFPLAMIYAGFMDLFTLKIRNTLVLALGVGWLLLAPAAGFAPSAMASSAAVALGVFIVTFFCFAMGWIGGGDAKLAAVTALWFDPHNALLYFTYASFLGGLLTLAIVQLRTQVLPPSIYRLQWVAQLHDNRTGVPYGAAMAPAALIVFPQTAWLTHAAF